MEDSVVNDGGGSGEEPPVPETPTLATPSISLTGDKLLITTVENATTYIVFVDGNVATAVSVTTVDLSSLNLSAGTHSVTVSAQASGYVSSGESNSVIYTVTGSSAVTTLDAPTISLSGSTLTISPIDNATNYAVYANGNIATTISNTTLDLSTLNFSDGSYIITVKAQSPNYNPSAASNSVTYLVSNSTPTPTLNSPTISLSGDTLTISSVANATSYDIYVDGIAKASVTSTTFNLYTLGLEVGSYTITVKSKADGYESSALSNSVTYTVEAVVDENGMILGDWNDIIEAIEDGSYKTKYAVGNYMPLTLSDGSVLNMQIAAIDGDIMTGTNGQKAPITFISEEILEVMQLDRDGGTGWPDVDVRDYLLNTVWPNIPTEIQNAIVAVDKTYCDINTASFTATGQTMTNSESLWIPSYRELGFGVSYEDSGVIYSELFTDDNSRVKRFDGVATPWWTRTIKTIAASWNVTSTGSSSATTTHVTMPGVVLGFCLGAKSTLATPEISFSAEDETLSISPVEHAVYYDIYKDGVLFQTVDNATLTIDLREVGLVYGTYDFTVVARAGGFFDSSTSNTVSYKFVPIAGLYNSGSGFTGSYSGWLSLVGNSVIEVRDTTTFYRMFAPDGEPEGELWIPDTITTIGENALSGRTGITAIGIPASVTSIGAGAIAGCDALTTIVYDGTMEQWNAIAIDSAWNETFLGGTTNVTIKCTDGNITP
ncbi:MAG: leucine-rich repeat protein [Lachnospiraceae bacterium]|nr:leucine-rich repeat protein [Lachnospiraceae bacterium]